MKNKNKIIISSILAIAIIICISIFAIGNYLLEYAIGRNGNGGDRKVSLEVQEASSAIEIQTEKNKKEQEQRTQEFLKKVPEQIIDIKSNDGLKLVASYFELNSHRFAICIHGYRQNRKDMIGSAERFADKGFNVVMPDLRGCGESEGKYIGMGWLDKDDILCWIKWILQKDNSAEIVVYGGSMGGATTMMTSGETLPDAVKVFVEDCGYTDVWSIFESELAMRFHLPAFPILTVANKIAKSKAGYDFKQASSINQLKKSEKPMLFIHGEQDDFIPYAMLQKVYDAKKGTNKKMISFPETKHNTSKDVWSDKYWQEVFDFVNDYIAF